MTYTKIDSFEADLRSPHNLRLGEDGILWLYDGTTNAIVRVDLKSRIVRPVLQDESLSEFGAFGDLGVIGTMDGRVGILDLAGNSNPNATYVTVHDGCAIGSIAYDPERKAILILAANRIYRLLANGELDCLCKCSSPVSSIQWMTRTKSLWCSCIGLEIIDLDRMDSITVERRKHFQYTRCVPSPSDEVACFGGDVDILGPRGELRRMIIGDFNRGLYRPDGRLILTDIEFSEAGTIDCRDEFDVTSLWDWVAINPSGTRLVTLGRGTLSVFSIE